MKTYSKRLLGIAVSMTAIMAATAMLIQPIFARSQLHITPGATLNRAAGMSRSVAGIGPTREEIDEQGYDTTLPEDWLIALEDEAARLYFQPETGETALLDKNTNQIWRSNPDDREQETMVEGSTKLRLGAQFTISYVDNKGTAGRMDSYNDCVAYGNMAYSMKDDKLTVEYRVGKTVVTLADVPQQISRVRFEQLLDKLPEEGRKDLQQQYGLATLEGASDSLRDKMLEKYPGLVNGDVYYLKYDSTRILTKVREYLDQCGYSQEDLDLDNRENGVETESTARAFFTVVLEYTLREGALQVRLDGSRLDYHPQIPPTEIALLEYWGAASREDKGYALLPDGCGSLIYFNNGKAGEMPYSLRFYGSDTASGTLSQYVVDQKLSFPVFGIKRGRAAALVTVDQGESLCSLNARVAGMLNSYNTIYISYQATASDSLSISDRSTQIYREEDPYRGDVVLTYRPLSEEDADYMGMARTYRQLLLNQGLLPEKTVSAAYPLLADIICGVPSTELFLGLPVDRLEPMTTFAQAEEMARQLRDGGVCGLSLRLEGWCNGGLGQKWAVKIQTESALGGAAGLRSLATLSREEGWGFYPELCLSTVLEKGNGFNPSQHNIRNLGRDISVRYTYDYQNRYRRYDGQLLYQLSPTWFEKTISGTLNGLDKLQLTSIGAADLGSLLYADYRHDGAVNREEAKALAVDALARLAGVKSLALSHPNVYALRYAAYLYDVPTRDSGFRVCDEMVPFYQTVVRGSLDYVSPALNYADDYTTAFLQAVECGAGLQYVLTYQTTALLGDTDYSYINKGSYADWEETIREDYARASAVLESLQGVEMVGHARVSGQVYRTDYENGTSVYVNYGEETAQIGELTVGARDFAAVREGG